MDSNHLSHIRVLEIAGGVAGAWAARLLADWGATVVKLEPRAGDPMQAGPDGGEPASFVYLNAGKRSATWDSTLPGCPDPVRELARWADIIIWSDTVLEGPVHGLDVRDLCEANPGAVVVAITPYGRSGPWAGRRADDILIQHSAGVAGWNMMGVEDPRSTPPLHMPANPAEFTAGMLASVAGLAGLLAGGPATIDISLLETMASTMRYEFGVLAETGRARHRARDGRPQSLGWLQAVSDGWVDIQAWSTNVEATWRAILDAVGLGLLAGSGVFADQASREAGWDQIRALLDEACRGRSKVELADQLQSKGVAAGPLLSSSEALEYPPFVERACFTTYAIGSHEIRLPASPVRPPPLHEARAAAFAPTTKRSIVRAGGATPPLSGLRVLDMSTVIAGPYCARLLVDLGADVIKLDDRVRSPLPGARGAWSGVWSSLNAGKRSVALDLTVPAEREALRRIILGCDIVIENSRPGAIAKLGIDLEDLRRAHPGLIVASLTGFGQSGRLAGYRAFFGTTHAMSGFAHANGRGMSPPPRGGAWADFLSGTAMTWAVLAALAARQRSGVGCHLDVAMTDVMIASLGTEFAGPGERGDGVSRSWVVPCAGPDDWLAVSVPDHAAERDLAVTVSAASEAGLEQALGEWAAARGAVEAAEALASSGVPAATSTRIADIARHPQLQARAFFDLADHAGAGSRELIGSPFGVTSWPRLTGLQAPAFGEHTAEVLSEVGLPATIVTGRAEAERRGAPEAHA